jgi:hypothetical protein
MFIAQCEKDEAHARREWASHGLTTLMTCIPCAIFISSVAADRQQAIARRAGRAAEVFTAFEVCTQAV